MEQHRAPKIAGAARRVVAGKTVRRTKPARPRRAAAREYAAGASNGAFTLKAYRGDVKSQLAFYL